MSEPCYLVIVHPAGELDSERAASYWTETPALPACSAEGASPDEAISSTRQAIADWLRASAARDPASAAELKGPVEVDVFLAL